MATEFLEIGIVATGTKLLIDQLKQAESATNQLATAEQRQAVTAAESAKSMALIARNAASSDLAMAKATGGGGAGSVEQLAFAEAAGKAKVATNDLSTAKVNLSSKEKELAASAEGATGKVGGLGGAMGGLINPTTLAIAGVAVLGKTLVSGIGSFESLTAEVRLVQGVMGGTAQQASLLAGEFDSLGIDATATTRGIFTLAAAIGAGKDTLNKYGIEVAKNKDGTNDLYGTLDNIRHAYQAETDATERATIAKELGARGLQNLIPLLNMTDAQVKALNEETKRSGRYFNSDDLNAGKEMSIAMREAKDAVTGLTISLTKDLGPVITTAAHWFTTLTDRLQHNRAEMALAAGVVTAIVVPALLKLGASMLGPAIGAATALGTSLVGMGASMLGKPAPWRVSASAPCLGPSASRRASSRPSSSR